MEATITEESEGLRPGRTKEAIGKIDHLDFMIQFINYIHNITYYVI